MRTTLASTLALMWAIGVLANVPSKLIHLLLLFALVILIWNLAVKYRNY